MPARLTEVSWILPARLSLFTMLLAACLCSVWLSLGGRVWLRIGAGAVVENAYVWDHAIVGAGAVVRHAIVGTAATLGANVVVQPGALGLSRIEHEFALFAWRNGAWEKVKSWPIPSALIYRDP